MSGLRDSMRQQAAAHYALPSREPDLTQYVDLNDYVALNGHEYLAAPLTEEELKIVVLAAETAQAQGCAFLQKECFGNAARVVLADETGCLTFAEGIAMGGVMPVHHAWAVIRPEGLDPEEEPGKVVDLTWRLCRGREEPEPFLLPEGHPYRDRFFGLFTPPRSYIGCEFDFWHVQDRIAETGTYLSILLDMGAEEPLLLGPRPSPIPAEWVALRRQFHSPD